MKKTIVSLVAGFLLAGTAATGVSAQSYEIEKGDTLNSIAENHDTTVNSLKDINDLDTNMILPGETLDIDGAQEQYKVEKGDTLGSISKEFDVSVSDLKEWNDLDSNLIVEGQKLNVQNVGSDNNEEVAEETETTSQEGNQAELDQVASEEDQEAAETEDADVADDQSANQEEDNQADTDQEAVKEDQANNNQEATEEEPANEESESDDASEGETVSVASTAYTAQCEGCSGKTSDGTDLNANPDEKVIAVDPDVIPLGSKVHVEGYGDAVAADTGGAINGDKIDVHVPDEGEANEWGNKNVDVTILD